MFTIRRAKDESREYEVDERGRKRLDAKYAYSEWERRHHAGIETQHDDDDDDEGDEDYVPEEEIDDEPLEYVSDDELLGHEDDKKDEDVLMDDVGATEEEQTEEESFREFWIEGLKHPKEKTDWHGENDDSVPAWYRGNRPYDLTPEQRPVEDDMFPLYYPGRDDASEHGSDASFECTDYPEGSNEWNDAKRDHRHYGKLGYQHETYEWCERRRNVHDDVEHIAGPKCKHTGGYSGHEISAEEMRGCQTAQCLVRKPNNGPKFQPLPDDEDFEKDGEFFLSGLTDHMPSRDENFPTVTPARHDCEEPHAENYIFNEDEAYDYALPFHPSCFEIFKRATTRAYGRVDVNTLTSWWYLDSMDNFDRFPRDSNVSASNQQWWSHENGTAYLVANPLYIPSLSDILEAAIDRSPDFSPQQRAFLPLGPGKETHDPFKRLPVELQFQILDDLRSKDIASLRLSSRVFSELPVSYFQKLLLREWPWLWEAWPTVARPTSSTPYSKWTTMTAHDAKTTLQRQAYELAALTDYVDIVKKEMPEATQQIDAHFARCYQEILDAHKLEVTTIEENHRPFYLPPDKTNYLALFTLIRRHWSDLRGLQNRKRIWTDCKKIMRRVEVYKNQGLVDEAGIVGDLVEVLQEKERKRRERRRRMEEQRAKERMNITWVEGAA